MFDSGKTAAELINELKVEADVAPTIPDSCYIDWLNGIEQTLYDNIIREELTNSNVSTAAVVGNTDVYTVSGNIVSSDYAAFRFEDLVSVCVGGRQLTKVSQAVGVRKIFPYSYWDQSGLIIDATNQTTAPTELTIYVTDQTSAPTLSITVQLRPKLKTTSNVETEHVKVPAEYIDMVKAKMRGEMYKYANEDALAAKWLADYNAQVEYFRAWIASKNAVFGN